MNKLYKFAEYLGIQEAAEYLEHLISEPVTKKDILSLFRWNRLPAFVMECCPIIELERSIADEEKDSWIEDKLFKPGETVGICYGFWMPCSFVRLDTGNEEITVHAFRDEEGRVYTLKNEDDEFLARLDEDGIRSLDEESLSFEPADILKIAADANSILPCPEDSAFIRRKLYTYPKLEIYNLMSNEAPKPPDSAKRISKEEKPSYILTIGAMLEVALSDPKIRSQDSLSGDIEEKFKGVRGLGKTSVNNVFAEANRALAAAKQRASQR